MDWDLKSDIAFHGLCFLHVSTANHSIFHPKKCFLLKKNWQKNVKENIEHRACFNHPLHFLLWPQNVSLASCHVHHSDFPQSHVGNNLIEARKTCQVLDSKCCHQLLSIHLRCLCKCFAPHLAFVAFFPFVSWIFGQIFLAVGLPVVLFLALNHALLSDFNLSIM